MTTQHPDHRTIHLLAARAECDTRTARRALTEGTHGIRVTALRERLEREIARLDAEARRAS
jgi:hypothetical protein